MRKKEAIGLFIRYAILIILALGDLWIFYEIFTPLTIYPLIWILSLFYGNAYLIQGTITIIFNGINIDIIPACVAGSAYYLLLILNLTTPMKKETRVKSIVFLMAAFLILNIIRVVFFSMLYSSGFVYFELAHKLAWYAISTIMVVAIWFVNVWIFNIRNIPIYNDTKQILEDILQKEKLKKKKRKSVGR